MRNNNKINILPTKEPTPNGSFFIPHLTYPLPILYNIANGNVKMAIIKFSACGKKFKSKEE